MNEHFVRSKLSGIELQVNRLVEVHCIIFDRDKIFHCKENLDYCLRDIEKMIRDHVKELYEHLDIIPFWKTTDSISK